MVAKPIYKHPIFIMVLLIVLQLVSYITGAGLLTYWINPIVFVGLSILVFYYPSRKLDVMLPKFQKPTSRKIQWLILLLGLFLVASGYEELRKLFVAYPLPSPNSDVIGQLEIQYLRWSKGEMPYEHIHGVWNHAPFPVYMPLHWLPMGIGLELGIDSRWAGIVVYFLCSIVFLGLLIKRNLPIWRNVLISILPGILLWLHVLFLEEDLAVSPEYLIAAYYMVLGAAIISKNYTWLIIAVILCLLSRYTFIFWLPILLVYSYKTFGLQKSLYAILAVLMSVLSFYVLPFLVQDPSIFGKGLDYHNKCAVGEMNYFGGDTPMGWTCTYGLHFAAYFKVLFSEMDYHKLGFIMRVVQGLVMLAVSATGSWFIFRSNKNNEWKLLGYLYMVMLLFFTVSPLSYRYYYITIMALSFSLLASMLSRTGIDNQAK